MSEVVLLKIADIDSQRMVIRVEQGKGGKDRYVMLSPQLLTILRTYWRLTRPKRWLFPGRDDERPLVPNVLHAACRSACAAAGLSKQVTVHTLRHTFATHLLESGADVRIIQVLLGHASLASTARYTRVATKTISNTPSPLDRLRLEVVPPHLTGRCSGSGGRISTVTTASGSGAAVMSGHRRCLCGHRVRADAVLGGHVDQRKESATRIASLLRSRRCPKCQGLARARWLADRQAELLPVPYFHVVFTLPAPVGEIAFQNKAAAYAILFLAAAETLATIAADPQHLGAQLGMTMVLHTWGQTLQHHPHVHCVVPGGGPSLDGTRWVACRPGFFLPVRVLSRLFRRLFLQDLQNAFDTGNLRLLCQALGIRRSRAFARHLDGFRRINGSSTQVAVRRARTDAGLLAAAPIASPSPTAG